MSKFRWDSDQVEFIEKWWPHFGTEWCASELNQTRLRVKSKVDGLKLLMLPKDQRLCIKCKVGYQFICDSRRTNKTCKLCESEHRKELYRLRNPLKPKRTLGIHYDKKRCDKTWDELFKEIATTLRYRNKTKHNCEYNLSGHELKEIFDKQQGKCYYSNRELKKPSCEKAVKDLHVISIDRIDSLGAYTPDNIVLCTYWANIAKSEGSLKEFIKICEDITNNFKEKLL
jgi:hypothetical protein